MRRPLAPLLALLALSIAACGSSNGGSSNGDISASYKREIAQAQRVTAADFPPPGGRTLQQIANTLPPINVGLATQTFTPGSQRLAFGLIDQTRKFVYGRTAVYIGRSPNAKALGPYPAPADPLVVDPPFRSRTSAEATGDVAAIYHAQIPVPRPGRWYVLAATKRNGRTYGAATVIDVRRSTPIPDVGARPPSVSTDTVASAGGDKAAIDTRIPPDDMHAVDFKDVVGKKPVALLFATPALCQSRVCGPVTDIAAQLQKEFGDRVTFIHQEVYVGNQISKGYRPQLRAFHLRSEPWLFAVDRRGRIAARLEGSFGLQEFRRAVNQAAR